MKYGYVFLLLITTLAYGQDSLFLQEAGRFPCQTVFKVDNEVLVGQITERELYFTRNSVGLFDISNPEMPREILRCMTIGWNYQDVAHQWPGVIREALIYDSLIIALQLEYSRTDTRSGDFWAKICAAPIRTGEIMAETSYESVAPEDSFPVYWEDPMPNGLYVAGDYLVVGMGRLGIYFLDLDKEHFFEEVSHIEISCIDFNVHNNRLAAIEYSSNELVVFDITDPTDPSELGSLDLIDRMSRYLSIKDGYLYLSPFNTGERPLNIAIFDLQSDDAPELVGEVENIAPCLGGARAIYGDRLYLYDNNYLAVYDINDPIEPERLFIQALELDSYYNLYPAENNIFFSCSYDNYWPDTTLVYYFGPDETAGIRYQPTEFSLSCYPNPFNSTTSIEYRVGANSNSPVRLSLYDLSGRLVQTLVNERLTPGNYRTTLDASNLTSGMYLIRLESNAPLIKGGQGGSSRKVVVMK